MSTTKVNVPWYQYKRVVESKQQIRCRDGRRVETVAAKSWLTDSFRALGDIFLGGASLSLFFLAVPRLQGAIRELSAAWDTPFLYARRVQWVGGHSKIHCEEKRTWSSWLARLSPSGKGP